MLVHCGRLLLLQLSHLQSVSAAILMLVNTAFRLSTPIGGLLVQLAWSPHNNKSALGKEVEQLRSCFKKTRRIGVLPKDCADTVLYVCSGCNLRFCALVCVFVCL